LCFLCIILLVGILLLIQQGVDLFESFDIVISAFSYEIVDVKIAIFLCITIDIDEYELIVVNLDVLFYIIVLLYI
jgi:hypothetical protein